MQFILATMLLVGNWRIYQKMGRPGWNSIVPFYNMYVQFEVLYGNGAKMFLLLIPFYNIYLWIKLEIDLAREFGQGGGFACGLIFLPSIFNLILGFGNYEFRNGTVEETNDTISDLVSGVKNNVTSGVRPHAADELAKYKELLDNGAISQEEYDQVKNKLLNL